MAFMEFLHASCRVYYHVLAQSRKRLSFYFLKNSVLFVKKDTRFVSAPNDWPLPGEVGFLNIVLGLWVSLVVFADNVLVDEF